MTYRRMREPCVFLRTAVRREEEEKIRMIRRRGGPGQLFSWLGHHSYRAAGLEEIDARYDRGSMFGLNRF